jgi:ribose transport system ATP-binding protein
MPDAPALQLDGIRKAYPGVLALDGVDLDVRRGEVHVLLGENGAGKSTLVKVVAGAVRPDAGRVLVGGAPAALRGPRDARALGVAVVHQELALVPGLTAGENVFLGREPRRLPGVVDRRATHARAQAILDGLGAGVRADAPVARLSLARRQLVEIARALALDARVLVLDEPTSALGEREAAALLDAVRALAARGVGVVYISHRLDELFAVGDRVTVLRDGRRVATHDVRAVDRARLVHEMADRPVAEAAPRPAAPRGAELLRVEGLTRRGALHDVSFALHAGEVVALAGLVGAGRTEVARALVGLDPVDAGRVVVRGRARRIRSPRQALRAGLALVPEDRKRQGIVPGRPIRENVALAALRALARLGVVRRAAERALAERHAGALRVRAASVEQAVGTLSGGNQQKVVLARWLAARAEVLILDEPTRGIDVAAREELYALVGRLAAGGAAILLVSSELPEVVRLADRVLVMRAGRVAGEFARGEATPAALLACAVGA